MQQANCYCGNGYEGDGLLAGCILDWKRKLKIRIWYISFKIHHCTVISIFRVHIGATPHCIAQSLAITIGLFKGLASVIAWAGVVTSFNKYVYPCQPIHHTCEVIPASSKPVIAIGSTDRNTIYKSAVPHSEVVKHWLTIVEARCILCKILSNNNRNNEISHMLR